MTIPLRYFGVLLALLGVIAHAESNEPGSIPVQDYQEIRIDEGLDRSHLNQREQKALDREIKEIRDAEARAKADGVITPGERMLLKRRENIANRSLNRLKRGRMKPPTRPPAAGASAPVEPEAEPDSLE